MASSVVISSAKELGRLAVEEAKYLYGVSKKIESLQRDLKWMLCFLENAEKMQKRDKLVTMWIAEIRDIAYEAGEIYENYVHKVSNHRRDGRWNTLIRWWMSTLYDARAVHEVGSNIDDLRTRIGELISRLQLYGVKVIGEEEEENLTYNLAMTEVDPSIDQAAVVGTKDEKLVEQLVMREEVKSACIWGMGGSGKTTIAQYVFCNTAITLHFRRRAWVTLSKQFETRVVFKKIITKLRYGIDEERTEIDRLTCTELTQEICEILMFDDCLVVLDDIWRTSDWDALKPAFMSIGKSGSKILITTRNRALMPYIDPSGYMCNPLLLDDDDSWKMLRHTAFSNKEKKAASSTVEEIDPKDGEMKIKDYLDGQMLKHSVFSTKQIKEEEEDEDPKEVEEMVKIKAYLGRQMLKQCMGEPWAVRILGGVLRNKETIVQWVTVRKTLKSYLKGDRKEERASKGLIAVLELSYNDLPFYLKPCFLYLRNFPEDSEISVERLYHLWEAEGLLTVLEDNGYEIQEGPIDYNTAESYLNQLVGRCLVEVCERWENGKIKSCRLPDIILDMCLQKCEQLKFLSIIKPGRSDRPSSQILSRYILNRKWHRFALHLEGTTSDAHVPLDPSSSNAPSIRSLLVFPTRQDRGPKGLFSSNKSNFFSRIRVLDLEGTAIPMDPKISQEFIHLRYLSFKGAKFISSLPTHIWNCKFLETLDLRWDTDAKLLISNKFCKLERLRHLYLPYQMKLEGSRWMIFTEKQLQQLGTLENFNVDICRAEDLLRMTSLRVFTFANVRVLSIDNVKFLLRTPMMYRKRLVNSLNLSVQPNVMINEKDSLRMLISLGVPIAGLDISGRIDAAANLEIFREFHLTELCLSGSEIDMEGILVIEELSHLVKLTLKGDAIAGTSMSFSAGGFPRLKRLSLLDLSELEEWEIEEGALPSLESLDITRCGKLKMIPAVLPELVFVKCTDPCVRGVERYNICPYSCAQVDEAQNSSPSRRLSTCFPCLHLN